MSKLELTQNPDDIHNRLVHCYVDLRDHETNFT